METFLRRLEILNYLRGRREATSTDALIQHLIAAGYLDESARQSRSQQRLIQRDMQFLLGPKDNQCENEGDEEDESHSNEFGLRVSRGQGKSQLWQLEPYSNLQYDFERMPAYMALTLRIAQRHLRPLLPSGTQRELAKVFTQAEQKLAQSEQKLSRQQYQRLTQGVEFFQRGQPLQAAEFDSSILDRIYQAILHGKRLLITYRSANGTKEYDLHPFGVAIMLPKLYLVAVKDGEELHEKSNFRSFLVHKIQTVSLSSYSNRVPGDFHLRDYLDEGNMDVFIAKEDARDYELILDLNVPDRHSLLNDLRDSPVSPSQSLEKLDDGQWQLRAQVRRTIQLRNWLLSLGSLARVQEPDIIRKDLLSWLDEMRERY